ncbi:trafficking protein particle complex subunit 8 [Trichonephila inaurata madagascariensis]|uniref:Trafficking protein particle complex subunit 8 n=1 Tax=Trichonephila inaurata madagascariensis TaxID=2747483 RepID=A0A8X6X5P6_9ARAC|nr:trafficking protein particle complex subunit 8 [Trichonephila inaurata madagascariensis]
MAALSVFMQNSTAHEYPMHYIESAITTYLHTCKLPELATRATFLSTECLKAKGLYSEAAIQFVRMPSEADLPSALCLEQAAYCYIHCKIPKIRKYAFHIILAGHRFSKSGQRKHALRSYKQAEQVYRSLGWNFANNHINFTIGRLSIQLDQLESACSAFEPLLVSKCQLPADEQANYLREYLFVLKRFIAQKSVKDLPVLPVPLINSEVTKVLLAEDTVTNNGEPFFVNGRGFDRGDLNNNVWSKLEEIVTSRVSNNTVCQNQLYCFTNKTDNTYKPNAIIGVILISTQKSRKMKLKSVVSLRNPTPVRDGNLQECEEEDVMTAKSSSSKSTHIDEEKDDISVQGPSRIFKVTWKNKAPVKIRNMHFTEQSEPSDEITSLQDPSSVDRKSKNGGTEDVVSSCIETKILSRIFIEPHQEKKIHLLIKPKQTGQLVITGIAYILLALKSQDLEQVSDSESQDPSVLSLQGKQCFSIRGSRLNRSAKERASKTYAQDNRLNINVLSSAAKLQVKFYSFPSNLYCGEVQKVTAELTNIGQHKIRRIIMASPKPGLFAIGNPGEINDSENILKEISSSRQPSPVIAKWDCDWMVEVLMPDGESCALESGASLEIPVWIKGPETPGDHNLDILFYYESDPPHLKLRYRLLQLSTVLVTYPAVSVQSHAMRSFCPEEKLSNFHPAAIPSTLILSVEVGNTSEELNQISLVQISCISKDWCFLPSEDNCRKGLPVIHSEESLMLTLKAIGFDPKVTVSSQKIKVFSHIPMARVEVDNSSHHA